MLAQKEDVYESSDIPEDDQNAKFARPETTNPSEVELIHVDMEAARKEFAGRIVNCVNVDFSDSIAKKRRGTYGSSAYVLEIVGKEYGEPETPDQKYNRLACEIAELGEMLANCEKKVAGNEEFLNENAVSQLLDELKATKIVKNSGSAQVLSTQKTATTTKGAAPPDSSLASVEARVRRVEALLGSVDSASPLIDALDDLKIRTEALNQVYLEGVETRLNAVIGKLDQVETRRKQTDTGEIETKVDTLYNLMSKWDATCTNLPANVKRLQTLRGLHEQASQFSERLSQLVGIREQMEKATTSSRMAMAELQNQTKEEISALVKQLTSLEAKLAK